MYQRKTVIRIGYEERTKYRLSRLSIAQGGRQFPLEEIEEIVLIRTYLQQDNMIAADLNVSIDRLEMTLRGRATAYELGDRLGRYVTGRRCKTAVMWQFGHHRPAGERPSKVMMRSLACVLFFRGTA